MKYKLIEEQKTLKANFICPVAKAIVSYLIFYLNMVNGLLITLICVHGGVFVIIISNLNKKK